MYYVVRITKVKSHTYSMLLISLVMCTYLCLRTYVVISVRVVFIVCRLFAHMYLFFVGILWTGIPGVRGNEPLWGLHWQFRYGWGPLTNSASAHHGWKHTGESRQPCAHAHTTHTLIIVLNLHTAQWLESEI